MQAQTTTGCQTQQSGRVLLVLSALIALAACTNATPPATSNASNGAVRVAGDNSGSGGSHSVTAVSDALGQRLDGMLSARQTGASANR